VEIPIRVSVLIPVYNRRTLIGDAVRSALSQDVAGLEVVVVDNHSDDGTWEYLQTLKDTRLRLLRNVVNLGLFGNFERCAEQARGIYSLFLCSDDRLAPGFLAFALNLIDAHSQAALLSSRGRCIDENGKQLGLIADRFPPGCYEGSSIPAAWFWTSYHYGKNPLNYPSGVLLRTSILHACLPFRTEIGAPADVDMFLRMLGHGSLVVSDYVGCFVMQHEQQAGKVARRAGELVQQDLALLAASRHALEIAGVYRQIKRQAACTVLIALLRTAYVDRRRALQLFREFDRSPAEMIIAALRRFAFTLADRAFGLRFAPHLKKAT